MGHFEELTAEQILELMTVELPWPERLGLVRAIPLAFNTAEPTAVEYLLEQARGSNRFIQAWAIDGLLQLAPTDPRTLASVEAGMTSGSAAVKSRIRSRLRAG